MNPTTAGTGSLNKEMKEGTGRTNGRIEIEQNAKKTRMGGRMGGTRAQIQRFSVKQGVGKGFYGGMLASSDQKRSQV